MTKIRLDHAVALHGLASSRSQAENLIKLGKVSVGGKTLHKPGIFVSSEAEISLSDSETYVSRAGLKLASVAKALNLDFQDAIVLDIGSSTGGFTDYALQHGARKVIAVDVGTNQLHPSLRSDPRIELHEKTDIRDFSLLETELPTIIVMDISFMSLRMILPHVAAKLSGPKTKIVAMLKPQFEAGRDQVSKGVIKNDSIRRQILKDFEAWAKQYFVIQDKKDSEVHGTKGNQERFYLLCKKAK